MGAGLVGRRVRVMDFSPAVRLQALVLRTKSVYQKHAKRRVPQLLACFYHVSLSRIIGCKRCSAWPPPLRCGPALSMDRICLSVFVCRSCFFQQPSAQPPCGRSTLHFVHVGETEAHVCVAVAHLGEFACFGAMLDGTRGHHIKAMRATTAHSHTHTHTHREQPLEHSGGPVCRRGRVSDSEALVPSSWI